MDKGYADTVRLLLAVAPEVFRGAIFAMKGGTAINLFLEDMPRLSVDIDVVYLPWREPREAALDAIRREISAIAARVKPMGLQARQVRSGELGEMKLIVENPVSQVKIEVNGVFRGTVLPVERHSLTARASRLFGVEFDAPLLARDELYAGKLCAALGRQHPRDLFDIWQLRESGGLTAGTIECFVVYLAGNNRPTHEVLFSHDKDIASDFQNNFAGMTEIPCSLDTLIDARAWLRQELGSRLTDAHRRFLAGQARAQPDWTLLQCAHAAELPALRWKQRNLEIFRERRPADFATQAEELERLLGLA